MKLFLMLSYLGMIVTGVLYSIREYKNWYRHIGWITIPMGFLIGTIGFAAIGAIGYGLIVYPILYFLGVE